MKKPEYLLAAMCLIAAIPNSWLPLWANCALTGINIALFAAFIAAHRAKNAKSSK